MPPLLNIDPNHVEKLARLGMKVVDIAELFSCAPLTISNRFREDYNRGRSSLKQDLRAAQIKKALSGDVGMLIWLGKQLLGQSDKFSEDSTATKITVNIGGNRDTPQIEEEEE